MTDVADSLNDVLNMAVMECNLRTAFPFAHRVIEHPIYKRDFDHLNEQGELIFDSKLGTTFMQQRVFSAIALTRSTDYRQRQQAATLDQLTAALGADLFFRKKVFTRFQYNFSRFCRHRT
jgi:hypothetical protein